MSYSLLDLYKYNLPQLNYIEYEKYKILCSMYGNDMQIVANKYYDIKYCNIKILYNIIIAIVTCCSSVFGCLVSSGILFYIKYDNIKYTIII